MPAAPVIVWFRQDLRVADNPALARAAATGRPVIPVYVLDDETPGRWRMGGAGRWWLHGSLLRLDRSLRTLGAPLVLRQGRASSVLADLVRATAAAAVLFNRHYEPFWRTAEAEVARALARDGVQVEGFDATLLFPPGRIVSRQGASFRVFTPFWTACRQAPPPATPQPAPPRLRPAAGVIAGDDLDAWRLLPGAPDWAAGLRATWTPGEAAAATRLYDFLDTDLPAYGRDRDRPEPAATSRLSPHLHFGEISPGQVWHATMHRVAVAPACAAGGAAFLRELGWREFCFHTLIAAPQLPEMPLQERFARFPWAMDDDALRAWQTGRTGYPIVDAGMRQLWQTGWMHNRVRMIAASFLVKDLLLPWQAGEAWFWDTLVDADLANNAGGWQWVAGCGTDAAPYFRIFNPVTQGEKFDPAGAYVRRWLPELARLPNRWVHRPWMAPPLELAAAGVRLGATYSRPLVDHGVARARALAAFAAIKEPE